MKKETKFINSFIQKEDEKTVFDKCLYSDGSLKDADTKPNDWLNVMWLGFYSDTLGDMFKCWDDDPNCFTIYFGKKGNEFN